MILALLLVTAIFMLAVSSDNNGKIEFNLKSLLYIFLFLIVVWGGFIYYILFVELNI